MYAPSDQKSQSKPFVEYTVFVPRNCGAIAIVRQASVTANVPPLSFRAMSPVSYTVMPDASAGRSLNANIESPKSLMLMYSMKLESGGWST